MKININQKIAALTGGVSITSPLARFSKTPHQMPPPPRAGGGVHLWLFKEAIGALKEGIAPEEIKRMLLDLTRNCGRYVPAKEVEDAILSACRRLCGEATDCATSIKTFKGVQPAIRSKWPPLNQTLRESVAKSGATLADLEAASPVQIDVSLHTTKWFLARLFRMNDLVCAGREVSTPKTLPMDQVLRSNVEKARYIVPSPMSSVEGLTQEGKPSQRSLDNTGPVRYLITEFDTGGTDEHAAIIDHLRSKGRLVMVLSSGGKSLHAWWSVEDQQERERREFFGYAVSLGADPMTWTKSQFVRIPHGIRENGNLQRVYYFDQSMLPEGMKKGGLP